jgi:hypothetical protein
MAAWLTAGTWLLLVAGPSGSSVVRTVRLVTWLVLTAAAAMFYADHRASMSRPVLPLVDVARLLLDLARSVARSVAGSALSLVRAVLAAVRWARRLHRATASPDPRPQVLRDGVTARRRAAVDAAAAGPVEPVALPAPAPVRVDVTVVAVRCVPAPERTSA